MSAHVLLNLLNELEKRDKMLSLPSILSLFLIKFYKFNNTGAGMLDSIYRITLNYFEIVLLLFLHENAKNLPYICDVITGANT